MSAERKKTRNTSVPESVADPSGTWISPTGEALVLTGKGAGGDGSGYVITGSLGQSGLMGASLGYAISLTGRDSDAIVSWIGTFKNETNTMTTQVSRQDTFARQPLTTSTIIYRRN